MKIAIVGTGVSGLVAAYLLQRRHDIEVFEANDYIGGHTHTHEVWRGGRNYAVDSGFIVFNETNYANFTSLLEQLGVASQPTSMSFSVSCARTGLEYNGTSLRTLFAQRRNLFRPAFYRMIGDILRFGQEGPRLLDNGHDPTLWEFVEEGRYSRYFRDYYLLPMASALWSAPPRTIREFPARSLVRFFDNHGMLKVSRRPIWRVVRGGSREYVKKLTAPFRRKIHLQCPIAGVTRHADHVTVRLPDGSRQQFDHVVLATHSDQALRLLEDRTATEAAVLGAIPYQRNEVTLHTDPRVLPRRRRAWASWNYRVPREERREVSVTYNMNMLQQLAASEPFCVTLNDHGEIDEAQVIERTVYHHPVFTKESVAAQARFGEINGPRTHYCGAYWGYGFHEDGVRSALRVCEAFGETL